MPREALKMHERNAPEKVTKSSFCDEKCAFNLRFLLAPSRLLRAGLSLVLDRDSFILRKDAHHAPLDMAFML
jgi:hypothetical protein